MITIDIRKSKKIDSDYSLFISFPYDTKIINVIRELPTRYWLADKKEWEAPLDSLSEIINRLPDYNYDITGKYVALKPKCSEMTLPSDFQFKTKPFNHQIDGFNYGLSHDKWFLGDEQGLGKTKQVIDICIAKKLQAGYRHCLIICGVNGLKWNWFNEIHTHSDEEAHILGMKTVKGKLKVGSTTDKLNDLKYISSHESDTLPYFLITNVESLRDDNIASEIASLCSDGVIGVVAIDEIHKCKNPSSQQGKGILKVKSENRIAMTGTPLMNTPLDLYIIFKWLGYDTHSFYAFKNHYCIFGGYGGYETVGYKNLDELQDRLNKFMLRRLKNDVLDLPDKLYIDEYVEMTPKQSQIYKEVSMEIKAHIDEIAISPNPLAQLIRLRQATGYTGILSSTIKESAKLDRMEELVDETIANGQKVVIFSNWTQMTDAIYDRLFSKQYGIMRITGETPDNTRQDIVNSFQNTDMCQVLIGTIGAMGTGLTLTAGTVEIFMDEPWNKALKEQAEDRCHRIGAKQNVTIYTLLTKNTIDERIHDIVEQKGAMSDAIVDGKLDKNKVEMLDFLLS